MNTVATEFEIKFAVDDLQLLDCILCDPMIREKMVEPSYRYIKMETTYFDTEDSALSARKWMLRIRKENDTSVVTVKMPGEGYTRSEWSVEADYLDDAVPMLLRDGAPQELETFLTAGLMPVCGVSFTRILGVLSFEDGTKCELCGDVGQFTAAGSASPLCEMEIELTEGAEETMLQFARKVQEVYRLSEQKKSKVVRARELIRQ